MYKYIFWDYVAVFCNYHMILEKDEAALKRYQRGAMFVYPHVLECKVLSVPNNDHDSSSI